MEESIKKSMGSERPHYYRSQAYEVAYYNSNPEVRDVSMVHRLVFFSSATEQKHLNDIAVRKAKEHHWQWTSFLILDKDRQIVSTRVARKPKK